MARRMRSTTVRAAWRSLVRKPSVLATSQMNSSVPFRSSSRQRSNSPRGQARALHALRSNGRDESHRFSRPLNHRTYQNPSSSSSSSSSSDREIILSSPSFSSKEVGNDDGVIFLTFNRPKAANAMGRSMLSQLRDAVSSLEKNESVRCVVLTSVSPKVFSAGADLRERSKMSQEEASAFVTELRGTFDALADLPMPVVAAVEGVAVGGGLEAALSADVIVAGRNATFGLPETSLAIIPGAGGTQRLPRLVGAARAKEMIYGARKIDAATAFEYGMVQHLVDAGEAEGKALEIANRIAQNGPLAVRAAKAAINRGMDAPDLRAAMEIERECYQRVIPTEDRLEGLAAFREGRKPVYSGK